MEDALVGASLGKYKIEALLGQGGMGKVYRAFDSQLNRSVALKFVRSDDGEILERFLREARNQARVDHENICKIYEVGELDGKPYIALQLVEGKPVNEVEHPLTLEEKVMIIRDVADAVQTAHAQGLIHRDLKPGNIMIRQGEDGRWIPMVLDFGLARELAAPGLTISGMVLGSPAYMSPEQALGDIGAMDRRSDVYSLGVTLYEMLSGKRPFPGNVTTELLIQVVEDEPLPLSQASTNLPGDLEKIVMKCLEKEPERRYDSARLLAQDLTNFLHGDPVMAKSAGFFYRLSKKIRKNKLLSAVIAAFMVAGMVLLALTLHARSQAKQQARLAQKFGQDIEEVERLVQHGYLLPLHDTRREKRMVQKQLASIETEMGLFGVEGEASGHYALGRGLASLHDYEGALPHFQAAWDKDFQTPEVAFHLGQALGFIYKERMETLLSTEDDPEEMEAAKAALNRDYRDRALGFLKQGLAWDGLPNQYVRALIAFYEGRYDDAANDARQVFSIEPGLYFSKTLEGDIFMRWGLESKSDGQLDEAMRYYEYAGACYGAATDIARSDPMVYEAECFRLLATMVVAIEKGDSASEFFERAREEGLRGLKADPDSFSLHNRLSELNWKWCNYMLDKGQDTDGACDRAIELGEKALALKPGNADGHLNLGFTYLQISYQHRINGGDAAPFLEKAAYHARAAIEIKPNLIDAHNCLGVAMMIMGAYELEDGLNPISSLKQAASAFEQMKNINPNDATGLINQGITWVRIAGYRGKRGEPYAVDLKKARSFFRAGIELDPSQTFYYMCLGRSHVVSAELGLAFGEDPTAHFQSARESLVKAMDLNKNYAYNHQWMGRLLFWEAKWEELNQRDANQLFQKSESALEKAVELNPQFAETLRDLSETRLAWARYKGPGKAAMALLEQNLKVLGEAESFSNGRNADVYRLLGLTRLQRMEFDQTRKIEVFESARVDLQKALDLNDANPDNWIALARLCLLGSDLFGTSKPEILSQGLHAVDKALEINKTDADAWFLKSQYPGIEKTQAHSARAEAAQLNPLKYSKDGP